MLVQKIKKYLADSKIKHEVVEHKTVYTAYDAAQTLKMKLGEIVKNLLVQVDRDYYVVLLPADKNLDFKKLEKMMKKLGKKAKIVKIPAEKAMLKILKLKKEALSAFGQVHKLPVIIEKELLKRKQAIFSGGSFVESVKMAVKDFVKLEKPIVGVFGVKKKKIKKS